ncbi:uncharacterized protein PHALS_12191 [Plasmopara halstedii]|uniref:Uncharacterized protein n=1 Tax=Plasmopara halstedii TaxID=4781 RepID=A0A0P1AKS6_PLAHL|nr:uncharacterized protein PHALS_12191 [Plasmopara halstedii]CEG41876.1 hypothetical protein PHALS_12191 [Plasmopara halstedii]|eukprot:XP_024578245.1 hypothetical protein PHALS_12191 [Plasmopara halstedii]
MCSARHYRRIKTKNADWRIRIAFERLGLFEQKTRSKAKLSLKALELIALRYMRFELSVLAK